MLILGIETSCDDTASAVLKIEKNKARVLSNVVLPQTSVHAPYGGVVPQIAAKMHSEAITKVIGEAIKKAGLASFKKIDLISVTAGPGLIITLLVGVSAAKTLAMVFKKPIIGVNHLEGHIYAHELATKKAASVKTIKFPTLCLLVSGGHTMLILMEKHLKYKVLGETRDDAAGEAFDKVARLLELGYPGGPLIEQTAKGGDCRKFDLPRAMIKTSDYDFSLSGLKTAIIREVKSNKTILKNKRLKKDLCASFQYAAFEPLVAKLTRAAKEYGVKTIILGGGVAANITLHRLCKQSIAKNLSREISFKIPGTCFTSDNASMIALAGYYHYRLKGADKWQNIRAKADLSLK